MSCNISRENTLLNDDLVPHMIEDCYSEESWNQPDFDDKCCKGGSINGSELDGQCRPTIEGGYCYQDIDESRIYYKYRMEKDDGITPHAINRGVIGRETPYTEDADDVRRAGIEDTADLQREFYNELMTNRILKSAPDAVKRNLEKEELNIEEIEEDDLRELLKEVRKEEKKEETISDTLLYLLLTVVLIGIGGAIYLYFNKQNKGKNKLKFNLYPHKSKVSSHLKGNSKSKLKLKK